MATFNIINFKLYNNSKMINKKWLIGVCILMFVLTLSSFVFARPTSQRLDAGLTLQIVERNTHILNNDYYLHTHVYDTELGYLVEPSNETVCEYHMYSENVNWEHLITDGSMIGFGSGYYDNINKSYFNKTGDYIILLWCEKERDNVVEGGFIEFSFTVHDEDDLETMTPGYLFLLLGLLLAIILIGMVTDMSIISLLGSLGLGITSIFIFPLSVVVGIITLLTGLLLALYFAMKE